MSFYFECHKARTGNEYVKNSQRAKDQRYTKAECKMIPSPITRLMQYSVCYNINSNFSFVF